MRSEYGNLIREVRKAKGYTQKQLAAEAKIAINSLRRYESGERQVPIHVLKSIAEVLKVNWLCLIPGVHRGAYLVEEAIQNSDMPKDAVISPFSKEYSEIVSSTIDEAGLTVIGNDGNIIKHGDGKPFRKMSDSEMHKAGFLKFNSEEDRIAHFYSKLNTDGRLIAAKCFYKNLDSTKLSEVADYVEQLADTPQFQKTDTKEEK